MNQYNNHDTCYANNENLATQWFCGWNDTGDFIDNDDDDDDDRDVYPDKDGGSFNLSDAALNNGDSDEYVD